MSQNIIDKDIDSLQENIKNLLPKNAEIGQTFKIKSINEDGSYIMEPVSLFDTSIRKTTIKVKGHQGTTNLYRFGAVVFYAQVGDFTSLSAGWTNNIAQIPEGFRPIQIMQHFHTCANLYQYQVNTSGAINVYNYGPAITSAINGGIDFCWITNDP